MARQLKLVRLDDFISDIDSIDLFAGGYSLAEDGYTPMVAPLGATSVHEVITLKIQGSSKDNLATLIQAVDAKIKQVQWWLDDPGIERYQVWLRVQQDNETYARQAQILNILPPDKIRVFQPEEYNNNYIGEYSIGIERTPFWEGATANEVSKESLNVIGGSVALSAAVLGDVPARMLRFRINPHASSNNLSTFWAGFKTSRFGTAANFVPVWSLPDKSFDADTSAVSDSSAYSGTRLKTTFAIVATMKGRTYVSASDASPTHADDQRGTFLVLLRAKMSDTSISRARIAYSFNLTFPVYRSRQVISGTAWKFYEMGVVKNPPTRIYNYHNLATFSIEVDAERISGTGELHLDCLVLIPIDDGALKVTTGLSLSAAADQKAAIFQAADDSLTAIVELNGVDPLYTALAAAQNGWGLPTDATAPLAVVAGNEATAGCIKGGLIDIAYTYITRWRTLRGNTA